MQCECGRNVGWDYMTECQAIPRKMDATYVKCLLRQLALKDEEIAQLKEKLDASERLTDEAFTYHDNMMSSIY